MNDNLLLFTDDIDCTSDLKFRYFTFRVDQPVYCRSARKTLQVSRNDLHKCSWHRKKYDKYRFYDDCRACGFSCFVSDIEVPSTFRPRYRDLALFMFELLTATIILASVCFGYWDLVIFSTALLSTVSLIAKHHMNRSRKYRLKINKVNKNLVSNFEQIDLVGVIVGEKHTTSMYRDELVESIILYQAALLEEKSQVLKDLYYRSVRIIESYKLWVHQQTLVFIAEGKLSTLDEKTQLLVKQFHLRT